METPRRSYIWFPLAVQVLQKLYTYDKIKWQKEYVKAVSDQKQKVFNIFIREVQAEAEGY